MARSTFRVDRECDCPSEWPTDWCHDFATQVEQLVPSDAPGTWALRCASCGTVESGLGMIEAHALEGLSRTQLAPCCLSPDRRAEPALYVRRDPPSCPRCGLTIEHYHLCRFP